jgi:hypothetical protein
MIFSLKSYYIRYFSSKLNDLSSPIISVWNTADNFAE